MWLTGAKAAAHPSWSDVGTEWPSTGRGLDFPSHHSYERECDRDSELKRAVIDCWNNQESNDFALKTQVPFRMNT